MMFQPQNIFPLIKNSSENNKKPLRRPHNILYVKKIEHKVSFSKSTLQDPRGNWINWLRFAHGNPAMKCEAFRVIADAVIGGVL